MIYSFIIEISIFYRVVIVLDIARNKEVFLYSCNSYSLIFAGKILFRIISPFRNP